MTEQPKQWHVVCHSRKYLSSALVEELKARGFWWKQIDGKRRMVKRTHGCDEAVSYVTFQLDESVWVEIWNPER